MTETITDQGTNGTYVKLFRKSEDSEVFQNPGLWHLWSWCLLRATYRDRWVPFSTGRGASQVHLLPGQFIHGRASAAQALRTPESTVEKRLKKLASMGNISITRNTHYSIVTVCNWTRYQSAESEEEQARNTQGTGKEHKQEGV